MKERREDVARLLVTDSYELLLNYKVDDETVKVLLMESHYNILNLLFQAEVTIESRGCDEEEIPASALAYHLIKKKDFSKDSYRFETTSAVKLLIRQNASLKQFSAFSDGCRANILSLIHI